MSEIGSADATGSDVITVSCTGFFCPGPDYRIVRALGLSPSVQRYHLGFMGCYAAVPALRLARQLCEADADAVVLVVSVELCTLHLRTSNDPDTIVATSLFGDGAGAALVTARPPAEGERALEQDEGADRVAEPAMGKRREAEHRRVVGIGVQRARQQLLGALIVAPAESALGLLEQGAASVWSRRSDGLQWRRRARHWPFHARAAPLLEAPRKSARS